MREQSGDQAVIRPSHSFLRLHHFNGIGHASRKAVAGLHQSLVSEVHIALRHRYLIGSRLYIQESRAHLKINLPSQIRQFVGVLLQSSAGLIDITANASPVEDLQSNRTGYRKDTMRAVRPWTSC